MRQFQDVFKNRRVLITGHTGFKGSWLSLWLNNLGAKIVGLSLPPNIEPSHFQYLNLDVENFFVDIRDVNLVKDVLDQMQPEIVFHLAAQPLVRRSYDDPLETWSTNVMGTANLLDACRQISSVKAIVCITTDKCYDNQEWVWGYRETDRLGGHDPYSASKAATELVAASYRQAFFGHTKSPLLATARAGNVIGGGDWSQDRLIPDMIRSIEAEQPLEIRFPRATRPWQHVLESLSGYLLLGQRLLQGKSQYAEAWNFGPTMDSNCTVETVLKKMQIYLPDLSWQIASNPKLHEAGLLYLDSSKALNKLAWRPIWDIDQTLQKTADWYQAWLESKTVISHQQLCDYIDDARMKGCTWACE